MNENLNPMKMSMTKRTIEMTTEQMEQILDGAPDGAEYYMRFGALYYKIDSRVFATSNGDWFASNFKSLKHLLTKNPLKLSDIRAELDHLIELEYRQKKAPTGATHYKDGNYYKVEDKNKLRHFHKHTGECVQGCSGEGWSQYTNGTLDDSYLRLSPTIEKSACLSDSAKNDTQSDLRAEQSVIERVKLLKGATQFQLDDYKARQAIDVTDERTGAIKMCEHLINHIDELFKEVVGDE